MAVAEITQRHVTELAMTWWRRHTSPLLLQQGTLEHFDQLDSRLNAYLDGASLDQEQAFTHLASRMNPRAEDFQADVVAGLLVLNQCGMTAHGEAWLQRIPDEKTVQLAQRAVTQWLGRPPIEATDGGRTTLCPPVDTLGSTDESALAPEAMRAYRSDELRFTDAFGLVRGHYAHDGRGLKELPEFPDAGLLCSYVMVNPQQTQSCLKQAIAKGEDPAVVFIAAGVSGETAMLAWLLQCAGQTEIALLALDAFRRITGFDALSAQGLSWTLGHTIKKAGLIASHQAAQIWFDQHGVSLPKSNCFLGKTCDRRQLGHVLRHGYQSDREVAAMRSLIDVHSPVFPVRSKASIQHAALKELFPETSEAL